MNAKKILALMLCAMMLLSLAACGAKDNDKQADMSGDLSLIHIFFSELCIPLAIEPWDERKIFSITGILFSTTS